MSQQPPHEVFDQELAEKLIGKRLLVGVTHRNKEGAMVRRSQILGRVTVADRIRGICIRHEHSGEETWFPPDTRGIESARRGEYKNRSTGEIVIDPDYLARWVVSSGQPE
jgi:hypothetical protein